MLRVPQFAEGFTQLSPPTYGIAGAVHAVQTPALVQVVHPLIVEQSAQSVPFHQYPALHVAHIAEFVPLTVIQFGIPPEIQVSPDMETT